MQQEKSTAPFVLSLISGLIITIVGFVVSAATASYYYFTPDWAPTIFLFFWFGAITGIVIIIGAVLMYAIPRQHLVWGIVVLVFSIMSILSFGGLIVGFISGIIGGALGIAWKPSAVASAVPTPPQPLITRVCPQCGRVLAEDVRYCPHCGKALEKALE